MKVVFISNYLTLHQVPFCDELYKKLKDDFVFISTMNMEQERIRMGWEEQECHPYEKKICSVLQKEINSADIVLVGSVDDDYIKKRLEQNKIVIRYSERIMKTGRWHMFSPRAMKNMYMLHTKYRHNPIYLLCASAYALGDYMLFGSYWGKGYKWGYFPEKVTYTKKQIQENKENKVCHILWVGRMLTWKHPEMAIYVAEYLDHKKIEFHLDIIGDGEMKEKLIEMMYDKKLEHKVTIRGFMPPKQVRSYMERANIFLFTSDFREGWGAVLNEAMNSGCVTIANHGIGAAPYLINDGINGFLYRNKCIEQFCKKVEWVVQHKDEAIEVGYKAYESIDKVWNAEVAAERFLEFSDAVLTGSKFPKYSEGPLSKAKYLSEYWYRG